MSVPNDNSTPPAGDNRNARPRQLQGELWEDPVEVSARTTDVRSYIYVDEFNERITRRRIGDPHDDRQIDFFSFKSHETDYIEQSIRREDAERSAEAVSKAVRDAREIMKQYPDISSASLREVMKTRARNLRAHGQLEMPIEIDPEESRERQAIGLLKAFRSFCGRDSKEIVDLVLADLTREIRKLAAERRSSKFISAVVWRHAGGTVLSITWNAVDALLKRIGTTLGLIKTISK
jgi:hypothetical protein